MNRGYRVKDRWVSFSITPNLLKRIEQKKDLLGRNPIVSDKRNERIEKRSSVLWFKPDDKHGCFVIFEMEKRDENRRLKKRVIELFDDAHIPKGKYDVKTYRHEGEIWRDLFNLDFPDYWWNWDWLEEYAKTKRDEVKINGVNLRVFRLPDGQLFGYNPEHEKWLKS